jgi:hypothetical protein
MVLHPYSVCFWEIHVYALCWMLKAHILNTAITPHRVHSIIVEILSLVALFELALLLVRGPQEGPGIPLSITKGHSAVSWTFSVSGYLDLSVPALGTKSVL